MVPDGKLRLHKNGVSWDARPVRAYNRTGFSCKTQYGFMPYMHCDLVKIGVEQIDDAVVVLRCSVANRPALQDFHIGKGKFYGLNAFPLNPCRHHKAVGAVVI